jgi:signal transduction histidine kinase
LKNNFAITSAQCELGLTEIGNADFTRIKERLTHILEIQFLNAALVDSKIFNSTIAPGLFDLNAIVQTVVMMVSCSLNGIEPQLELHDKELPVKGDSMNAIRVLQNLLMNSRNAIGAAHRTEIGAIVIATVQLSGDYCRLSVSDNGCGMKREQIESFWADVPSDGARHGFGAIIIREGISALGGFHQIQSQFGSGTSFNVVLPLSPLALSLAASTASASSISS